MVVYYEHKSYVIDFPNDTKFFKLTRKYYPNKIFYLGGRMIKMKDLKAIGETRAYKKNKHHNKNKVNGGQSIESNLISMDISRHNAFHLLFKNLSFREAAKLLIRVCEIKERKKYLP